MKEQYRKIVSRIYARNLDPALPTGVFITFCLEKILELLRGKIKIRKHIFLGKRVQIKQAKMFHPGKNCRISSNVSLNALSIKGIIFGNDCSVGVNTRIECTGSFSYIGEGFKCGDNCGLGTDCFYGCAGGIEIGDDVIVGNFVSMHSENHNYSNPDIPIRLQGVNHKGIKIGNNCWIGAKTTILDGAEIGNGCIIAAGAVVTGKFPDNAIIAGIPAKIIRNRI